MNERVLSDADIAEMEKRTVDRIIEAIDSGDKDAAKRIARRMFNEFLSMHDLYRDWTTAMLSFIARSYGDQALEDAMKAGVKAWWLPNLEKLPKGPDNLRLRIKMFAAGLHGHLQPLHIEEDDEKITIQMRPCGSGGRLVLEGKYEGPDAFHTVNGPQLLTYGKQSLPVYCTHEPIMELVDLEANGQPFVVVEPAAELGKQHCNFYVYKDPSKVPAKYYERLGRSKPEPGKVDASLSPSRSRFDRLGTWQRKTVA